MPRQKAQVYGENAVVRPMMDPQAREDQICGYAMNEAEKQILNGTASPSVLVHFLRAASRKDRLERQLLEQQNELMRVKTEALQAQKNMEEAYNRAIQAFKGYAGFDDEVEPPQMFNGEFL